VNLSFQELFWLYNDSFILTTSILSSKNAWLKCPITTLNLSNWISFFFTLLRWVPQSNLMKTTTLIKWIKNYRFEESLWINSVLRVIVLGAFFFSFLSPFISLKSCLKAVLPISNRCRFSLTVAKGHLFCFLHPKICALPKYVFAILEINFQSCNY